MSELIKIEKQTDAHAEEAISNLEIAKSFVPATQEEFEMVVSGLKEIKTKYKDIDAERKELVQPLNDTVKRINSMYRPVLTTLTNTEIVLKKTVAAYQAAKEEEHQQHLLATQAAFDADDTEAVVKHSEAAAESQITKVKGMSTRKVWKFEITDVSKVPAEYLMVDERKVGEVVRIQKGETTIPGIRVYSEDVVAVRT